MKYGITQVAIAPLRSEPSDASEMVSQLFWGELFSIEEITEKWWKITTDFDGYSGYISANQAKSISDERYWEMQKEDVGFVVNLVEFVHSGDITKLYFGTPVSSKRLQFLTNSLEDLELHYPNMIDSEDKTDTLIELAMVYYNAPYLWGGKSPFGVDCSGLVQTVFRMVGVSLPRDARDQIKTGEPVLLVQEAQAGDLAFFGPEEGKITHVGIILDEQRILHASGTVRIDTLDHQGVFKEGVGYTHSLRLIKRVLA